MSTIEFGTIFLAATLAWGATAEAQDAERATHGDQAATPQVSYEAREGEVTVRQYQLGCLSQLTYLVTSRGEALVVDPQRDVDHYVRDAAAAGAKIRYVVLTHTNADFVAGHTELAAREGAEILISARSGSEFRHRGMNDGDRVTMGAAILEFVATPGHTLDSMCVSVRVQTSAGAGVEPTWIFTGDALFIGSIGRPDLAQGTVAPMVLASHAYDSIAHLRALPESTIVLPGHGAGSLCGAHLSPDTTSTIGRERETNPYFRIRGRSAFVARDVSGLPPAPGYFAYNVALNRKGPPVVDWTNEMPRELTPVEWKDAVAKGAWLVDLREAHAYAAAHVEGSVNVSVRGRLDTWTGIVIPFEAPIVLIGEPDDVREAAFRFKRIGLDHVVGHVAPNVQAARDAGLVVRTTELVTPAALAALVERGEEPIVVDVRTAEEHAELSIGEYLNLPLTDVSKLAGLVDRDMPLLFVCNSAYRSSMAVGLAERMGFRHVASLDGGLDAWLSAKLPVYGTAFVCAGPVCDAPTDRSTATRVATKLDVSDVPEPIEPRQLAALLVDQPGNYAIVDVRPAWQFAEYHVPGATNVDPSAFVAHVTSLPARARIVVVDRDGTTAWAIAGAASAAMGSTERTFRVLAGGTARFWREVEVTGVRATSSSDRRAATPAVAPAPPLAPVKPEAKKRSAGC